MLMIGMAALFLAGFLLLTVFGAQSFRSTAFGRGGNMDSRALSAYLVTAAKSGDHERAITVRRDAAAGDVLVLADGESGYALHVFCADGMLIEDYAPIDAPLSAERAQRIAATQRFEIVDCGGLLEIFTDDGRVLIGVRSERGES